MVDDAVRAEIAAAFQKDPDAFLRLRRTATLVLFGAGLQSEADDVVSGAILEVLEKAPKGVRDWPAYLATVVNRRAIDLVRSARVRHRDGRDYDFDSDPADEHDIDDVAEKIDVMAQLTRAVDALKELDPVLREVAREYIWQERSQAEIAADRGITQARVSQMVAEARKQLMQWMKGGES